MSKKANLTRDEFLYAQIKSNRSLYFGLTVVYGLATIAGIIMAIAALVIKRPLGTLTLLSMTAGLAVSGYFAWNKYKEFAAALEEIGSDPTGVDTRRTYSASTAAMISESRRDSKTYRQLWIAYGILGISMIGLGGLATVMMVLLDAGIALTLICAGLAIGGLVIFNMAIGAFRDWRMAKYLESLEA